MPPNPFYRQSWAWRGLRKLLKTVELAVVALKSQSPGLCSCHREFLVVRALSFILPSGHPAIQLPISPACLPACGVEAHCHSEGHLITRKLEDLL